MRQYQVAKPKEAQSTILADRTSTVYWCFLPFCMFIFHDYVKNIVYLFAFSLYYMYNDIVGIKNRHNLKSVLQ
jgi:hypothetical protein